jgi:cytochrome c oxidase subunit 2
VLLTSALAGCDGGMQSVLAPAGEQAEAVAGLWWYFFAVSVLVVVAVTVLLLYGPLRAREEKPSERAEANGRKTKVVAGGVAITFVILIITLLVNLLTGREMEAGAGGGSVVIEVTGHRFWWEVRYLSPEGDVLTTTANEIHLPVGEAVPIRVRTADVIHSFWMPNLHGKIDMIPGRLNRIEVRATEPGTFRGQCAEFCGIQHALMAFMVVAEPPERFTAWLARESRPALAPRDPLALRGLEVFLSEGCGECHTIRGTPADGEFGPDLTHLDSRLTLAAGVLPNTRGHLGGWITNPQRIKPGNNMPAVPLTGEELRVLLHYLETLE